MSLDFLVLFKIPVSQDMANDWDSSKGKLFPDNPFISRTPSLTGIDKKGITFSCNWQTACEYCALLSYAFYVHVIFAYTWLFAPFSCCIVTV